jgi:hypothetical protein
MGTDLILSLDYLFDLEYKKIILDTYKSVVHFSNRKHIIHVNHYYYGSVGSPSLNIAVDKEKYLSTLTTNRKT